jgi:hypothetical protein
MDYRTSRRLNERKEYHGENECTGYSMWTASRMAHRAGADDDFVAELRQVRRFDAARHRLPAMQKENFHGVNCRGSCFERQ